MNNSGVDASTSWRREFGIVKVPKNRPWQEAVYENSGGWEHLVGLSAEEICWQLENPGKDVRQVINSNLWKKERVRKELERRTQNWPKETVRYKLEKKKILAHQRRKQSTLARAGQLVTRRRDITDPKNSIEKKNLYTPKRIRHQKRVCFEIIDC